MRHTRIPVCGEAWQDDDMEPDDAHECVLDRGHEGPHFCDWCEARYT